MDVTRNSRNPSRRLRFRYIFALAVVAALTLVSQFYVQTVIETQRNDSTVIDVAGRQRMMSQRIAKLALVINSSDRPAEVEVAKTELNASLKIWESAHQRLRFGTQNNSGDEDSAEIMPCSDSERVNSAFAELQFHFDALLLGAKRFLEDIDPSEAELVLSSILSHEKEYLPRMHAIVGMLGEEAESRVETLELFEFALCFVTILALALEVVFVFEPAARRIASQFHDLQTAKQRLSSEFEALERSTARAEILPSGVFCETNEKFSQSFGYSRGELEGCHYTVLVGENDSNHETEMWQSLCSGNYEFGEFQWRHKNGETRFIQATFNPVIDAGHDEVTRIVAYFQDVTDKHLAEQAKQRLNAELHEAARQAGMAEVATGVLHNIGNVLTSVNVSAGMLREQITSIPLRHLSKATAIIGENKENLADFLMNDDRGKTFPRFMENLTSNFESGCDALLSEASVLSEHVDHIIQIISMQQSVAGNKGIVEEVGLNELVEVAIRLNEASLSRHEVLLVCDFCDETRIQTSRHEVLQILINLILNAHQACKSQDDGKVTVSTHIDQNDFVTITVRDNGIGIEESNLSKIFQYGFTTKSEGNGFGLHASANSANALGGSLSVVSEGKGKGASFTLRLPVNQHVETAKLDRDSMHLTAKS